MESYFFFLLVKYLYDIYNILNTVVLGILFSVFDYSFRIIFFISIREFILNDYKQYFTKTCRTLFHKSQQYRKRKIIL